MTYKLGSLFDGSGGFPLAGALCGVEPVWAAEIEPYPIAVTRSRFPNMEHLGDISKINGGQIEAVDIITFGSPCQDLSVAGKRAGLKHAANGDEETTRSGLFMEAVRIIKEMREATGGQFPRFALWENVPGAFSSNKGEDFRVVCEELIKIIEPAAVMPSVPKNGWPYADSYVGDGWSLAYRVFDAQYWGVPQRRRRIHLVADFGGECAREVLFEREGVRGYFAEGGTPWQATPADAQGSTEADDREVEGFDGYNVAETGQTAKTITAGRNDTHNLPVVIEKSTDLLTKIGGGVSAGIRGDTSIVAVGFDGYNQAVTGDVAKSLTALRSDADHTPIVCMATQQGGAEIRTDDKAPTITAAAGMSGNNQPVIAIPIHDQATRFSGKHGDKFDGKGNGLGVGNPGDPMNTLTGGDRHAVVYAVDQGGGKSGANVHEDKAPTLCTTHGGEPAVAYRQGSFANYVEGELGTLKAAGGDLGGGSENLIVEKITAVIRYIVRRLIPTECARLQGFADWWGHIERKDSLTDEEYRFWLEVRNTHAAINGKKVQDYTVKQMVTWYNKLWTDSAEYKMWGNGIALPPALYCLQGIVDALDKTNTAPIKETDVTDLSDAPAEIKETILKNAELLEAQEEPTTTTKSTIKVKISASRRVLLKRKAKHRKK